MRKESVELPDIPSDLLVEWVQGKADPLPQTFRGISKDTRTLLPGSLYVALRGNNFDGHDFLPVARAQGAGAALVERDHPLAGAGVDLPLIRVGDPLVALGQMAAKWRQQSKGVIIGVTGSSGKTSVKELLTAQLQSIGRVCATKGNLNNHIGLPLSLLQLMPDSNFGVFEAGSSGEGEIAALSQILQPDVALITSIGAAHIENFAGIEAIAREKGALFASLPKEGRAFISLDCDFAELLCSMSRAPVITTSMRTYDADFFGELTDLQSGALQIVERTTGEITRVESGLPGLHNAANVLLSFAAATTLGVPGVLAAEQMHNFKLPDMRWEVMEQNSITIVNDAYNANPLSMEAAIRTFMECYCQRRCVLVLGDMLELGPSAATAHQAVGKLVAELQPGQVAGVGPLMSSYMQSSAVANGYDPQLIQVFATASQARQFLSELQPNDVVLLKGSRSMTLEKVFL